MRKALKRKRRSCWCKPHKVGADIRWSGREFVRLREAEREIAEVKRK